MYTAGKNKMFSIQADGGKIFRYGSINTVSHIMWFKFVVAVDFFCRIVDRELV